MKISSILSASFIVLSLSPVHAAEIFLSCSTTVSILGLDNPATDSARNSAIQIDTVSGTVTWDHSTLQIQSATSVAIHAVSVTYDQNATAMTQLRLDRLTGELKSGIYSRVGRERISDFSQIELAEFDMRLFETGQCEPATQRF